MTDASTPAFKFIDLFAGIGGFHAAMEAFGGHCEYAVEIDKAAALVYEKNWGHTAFGDITKDADDDRDVMNVPEHDVLCAGFPCQPFSKSGAQRGMDEARGTLFFNILSIIKKRRPKVVLLENVRNLIGPQHRHEWDVIIQSLRQEGYHVSARPAIFSPHLLPAWLGGTPQVRERVFITATLIPEPLRDELIPLDGRGEVDFRELVVKPVAQMSDRFPVAEGEEVEEHRRHLRIGSPCHCALFDPGDEASGWSLLTSDIIRPDDPEPQDVQLRLNECETLWIDAWDEFEQIIRNATGKRLEGFPYWADSWRDFPELQALVAARKFPQPQLVADNDGKRYAPRTDMPDDFVPSTVTRPVIPSTDPKWKQSHLRRNYDVFEKHFREIIAWAYRWGVYTDLFPASRRKLEWQAQNAKRLWDTVMHFRPSGIRAKRPTYLPALVAITQTSIIGPLKRRLSPRETARLQGLPEDFTFGTQKAAATYKQMGNGVAVGAVWHVFREHVERDQELLLSEHWQGEDAERCARIFEAVKIAPHSPREELARHKPAKPDLEVPTPHHSLGR
jgi:DNA (cytosine-5)-methyltransferase 1